MKVILYGATGMVGAGVLLECLEDSGVDAVLAVGRRPCGVQHAKVHDLVLGDLADGAAIGPAFDGYDACFFCLGVTSVGMTEEAYTRVTHDFALAAGHALAAVRANATFCLVTGVGTDSTEQGRSMWARVKGRTENDLLKLPLTAYMFRPGYIQPMKGVRSRTALYRLLYNVFRPLYPVLRRIAPGQVTTTEAIGRAMLAVARQGYPQRILGPREINAVAES